MTRDEGQLSYALVPGWEQLPPGWSHGDVAGVATDSQDRVYVFNRGEPPGDRLRPRRPLPARPGARASSPAPTASPSRRTWSTALDDADHTVRCFSLDGELR